MAGKLTNPLARQGSGVGTSWRCRSQSIRATGRKPEYRSSSEAIVRETLDNRVIARQDASVSPVFGAGGMVRRRSEARKESMKAIVQDKYGSPDVLQLRASTDRSSRTMRC